MTRVGVARELLEMIVRLWWSLLRAPARSHGLIRYPWWAWIALYLPIVLAVIVVAWVATWSGFL